jgi:hypothetical protein
MLRPNSKPLGNFGRLRSPTAKEVALQNALKRTKDVITEKPRGAKSTSSACPLISQYRALSDPREIAEFGRKNRTVLANSDLHELIKCRIFAGKPLTGFCLTLLGTRTETQIAPVKTFAHWMNEFAEIKDPIKRTDFYRKNLSAMKRARVLDLHPHAVLPPKL